MGPTGSAPDISGGDILTVFSESDRPFTPLTAADVADELGCSAADAESALRSLADGGRLHSRQVSEPTRVWWPAEGAIEGSETRTGRSEAVQIETFVDSVKDYAIFMLDPEGRVASWNDGAERIKGYAEEDIVGEHFSTFYTDEDRANDVPAENLRAAAENGRVEDEGWRVRADGTEFWADVVITAIRADDGTLRGYTKVTRDLTERREYEQKLRQERDLVERILETVPVSITVLTAEGEFLRANSQALGRLDVDEAELRQYSASSWDLYDEDDEVIPPEASPWRRAAETGSTVSDFQCQVELPELGRQWLSINAAPIDRASDDRERVVLAVDDITDQKKRERELRRERNQTEELLRTAPMALVVQRADGETLLANERAQEFLGMSEEEIIDTTAGVTNWTMYDSDGEELPPGATPAARARDTGEPVFEEEIAVEGPDGERTWFSMSASPVFDPDGALDRIIVAAEDITQLKGRELQLEQRKSELETELSEILGRISDAFYALDEEWRFTHVNDQAVDVLQHSPESLIGERIWDVFPNAAETIIWDRFHEAMETQEPANFEYEYEEFGAWLEINAYPSETGISVYFQDVTGRKEHERALEESERRYRTLIEHFPDGAVGLFDEDLRYTAVGGQLLDQVGLDPEDRIGQRITEAYPEEIVDEYGQYFEAALSGDANAFESEFHDRHLYNQTLPVRNADDEVFAGMLVAQDITERVEYRRQLEETIEKLEASNERLEQFAYIASHDLQEPLRMVSSYLELLESRYRDELDEDAEEFIDFAVEGADRMRAMVDDLLAYSRIDHDASPMEPTDPERVLDRVLDQLQLQIRENDARVTVGDLPSVVADENQLEQAFQNLVSNAIKYRSEGTPRIEIDAEERDGMARFSVADNGIGIEPEYADRIFQVFKRLHGRDEYPGTGIGLALCQKIVRRHDGEIWVESEPGEGSTFYFTIPTTDGDA